MRQKNILSVTSQCWVSKEKYRNFSQLMTFKNRLHLYAKRNANPPANVRALCLDIRLFEYLHLHKSLPYSTHTIFMNSTIPRTFSVPSRTYLNVTIESSKLVACEKLWVQWYSRFTKIVYQSFSICNQYIGIERYGMYDHFFSPFTEFYVKQK